MQVLVVHPPGRTLPDGTDRVLDRAGWNVTRTSDYRSAIETARTGSFDAVVLAEPSIGSPNGESTHSDFSRLVRLLEGQRTAGVVLADRDAPASAQQGTLMDTVDRTITANELKGRLVTIERYHGFLQRMEQELRNMERLSRRLNQHFREVDEEMRLAARLQRDFLPKISEPIGPLRFSTIFRPASWVSGDIFDVFRIDEDHTGFYVADAVGHGVSASLLTMFIKRAIQPTLVENGRHRLLTPAEVMTNLNQALTDQALPNCQFVTACYALINHRTLTLSYARGGHPYPVLITPDGKRSIITELRTSGGLLGLFRDESFPSFETHLNPGDKLVIYTDGIELGLGGDVTPGDINDSHLRVFQQLGSLNVASMTAELESRLDAQTGSLAPSDDITVVAVEIGTN